MSLPCPVITGKSRRGMRVLALGPGHCSVRKRGLGAERRHHYPWPVAFLFRAPPTQDCRSLWWSMATLRRTVASVSKILSRCERLAAVVEPAW